MTLEEFVSKVCSNKPVPATIYVFYNRDSAENFIDGGNEFELVATIKSDYIMDHTFKREFCDEKVSGIFAMKEDTFSVVLDIGSDWDD